MFSENGFDLCFEGGIFISHPLFGVNGDVIGTLRDPEELADPVDSKKSSTNLVSPKLDYFPLGDS